jgi:hypothetical protein
LRSHRQLLNAIERLGQNFFGLYLQSRPKHVRKIIYETKALDDIPNEVVMALAKERNRACYVFSAPDIVEELAWTPTMPPFDDYPTIALYLGGEKSDEIKIDDNGVFTKINSDFDTGTLL